jgi:hypothetical protein
MQVESRIITTEGSLTRALQALAGRLTLRENIQAKVIEIPDTGPVNTEFIVTHSMGKIPTVYIYNMDRAGTVYDSQRSTWTNKILKLKCTAANAVVVLVVL